jgi:hypothetical protein
MFVTADQDYMPLTSTEAKRLGLAMYFTGVPCKNGHVTSRYASSAECFFCRKDKNQSVAVKEKQAAWSKNNHEQKLKIAKERYERNKVWQHLRGRTRWVAHKEKVTESTNRWLDNNIGMRAFYANKRRSAKKYRTPAWANLDAIKTIYANCPEGYHVDHVIPLQGKNVSGFHIESNLQYLPASENAKKLNKYQII